MKQQKGFSLIELLIVVAVIGVIAAMAVPNLIQSRLAANEASAISSVRNIVTAEHTFASTIGGGQFGTMADLVANQMIDNALGSGTKDGYNFTVTPAGATFTVVATPVTFGTTGRRGFYSDQSGVIRFTTDGSAPGPGSPPLGGQAGGGSGGGSGAGS